MLLLYTLTVVVVVVVVTCEDGIQDDYTHHTVLDPAENYHIWWKFDDTMITVKLKVKTNGWLGWGLSKTGNMKGSDMVLAWYENNQAKFVDSHAVGNVQPVKDEIMDYEVLEMNRADGYMNVVFKRKLQLCNQEDLPITTDTIRLLWAYGDSTKPSYHKQNKGSKSIVLVDYNTGAKNKALPADTIIEELRVNNQTALEAQETLYICEAFKIMKPLQKLHLIRIEPIIEEGHENLVHHMALHRCQNFHNESYIGYKHKCHNPNMPDFIKECKYEQVYVWAIGGIAFDFPEKMGYPIGDRDDDEYFVIEIHYDNQILKPNITDTSGFRLYLTRTLRPADAAILGLGGKTISDNFLIPQQQNSFKFKGFCSSQCLNITDNPPKIYAGLLHTHISGTQIVARLVNDETGKEVKRLQQDLNYDFNLQESRVYKTPIEIPAGHSIQLECTYNTENSTKPVLGGYGTRNEMCLLFLLVSPPPPNIRLCVSTIPMEGFLTDVLKWNINKTGHIQHDLVLGNTNYTGKKAWKILQDGALWENKSYLVKEWEEYLRLPRYKAICVDKSVGARIVDNLQAKLTRTLAEESCVKANFNSATVLVIPVSRMIFIVGSVIKYLL